MIRRLSDIPTATLILTGFCVFLAAATGAVTWLPEPSVAIATPAPNKPKSLEAASPAASPSPIVTALPPIAAFAEIESRPLFRPSRRPPMAAEAPKQVEAPPPQTATASLPSYTLVGVFLSDDDRVAMLKLAINNEVKTVRVGEILDSWRVAQIDDGEVVLRNSEREIRIAFPVLDLGKTGISQPGSTPGLSAKPNPSSR